MAVVAFAAESVVAFAAESVVASAAEAVVAFAAVVAADPLQIEVHFVAHYPVDSVPVFAALCYQPPGLAVFLPSVPQVHLDSSKNLQVSFAFAVIVVVPAAVGIVAAVAGIVVAVAGIVVAVVGIVAAVASVAIVAQPTVFVHSLPLMASAWSALPSFSTLNRNQEGYMSLTLKCTITMMIRPRMNH